LVANGTLVGFYYFIIDACVVLYFLWRFSKGYEPQLHFARLWLVTRTRASHDCVSRFALMTQTENQTAIFII